MSVNDSEANETVVEVDETTDDNLDDFTAEFFGKPKAVEEVEEEVAVVDETDAEEDEGADEETDVSEEDEEEEVEEPQPKKNRKSAKERISELTAKVRETEANYAARIAALEAQLANKEEPKEKAEPKAEATDGRPDPDAKDENGELKYPLGKFDPDFAADVVRWTFKVEKEAADAARKAQADEEAATAAQNALLNSWDAKLQKTEETVPDLREKIVALEGNFTDLDPTFGQYLVETIMTLDRGPEVLYYLADNISEAEAIVAMTPRAATIALGRIEGRLPSDAEAISNKKKVSTAPKPPVSTRGSNASRRVAPDTDNLEDFEREFFKPKKV